MTDDINGTAYFSPARGMCYSAAAMHMNGFPVRQTICIRTDRYKREFILLPLYFCIRTNRSTPLPILCFQFFVAFTFVIRIMHKWNISLSRHASAHHNLVPILM